LGDATRKTLKFSAGTKVEHRGANPDQEPFPMANSIKKDRTLPGAFLGGSALLFIALFSGCDPISQTEDTCVENNDARNMQAPSAPDGLVDNNDGTHTLKIAWEPLEEGLAAALANNYFEPTGFDGTGVTSVEKTDDRELTVAFADLLDSLNDDGDGQARIFFDDRRHHIDCTHPGMDDRYFLLVRLDFDEAGDLLDVSFEQDRQLGDI
jgi:hypothetical protein